MGGFPSTLRKSKITQEVIAPQSIPIISPKEKVLSLFEEVFRLHAASSLSTKRNLKEAISQCSQISPADIDETLLKAKQQAHFFLGEIYQKKQKLEKAKQTYLEAQQFGYDREKVEVKIRQLETLHSQKVTDFSPEMELCADQIFDAMSSTEDQTDLYEEVENLSKNISEPHLDSSLKKFPKMEKALSAYSTALQFHQLKQYSMSHKLLGETIILIEDAMVEVIAMNDKVKRLTQTLAKTHFFLGQTHQHQHKIDEAYHHFSLAKDLGYEAARDMESLVTDRDNRNAEEPKTLAPTITGGQVIGTVGIGNTHIAQLTVQQSIPLEQKIQQLKEWVLTHSEFLDLQSQYIPAQGKYQENISSRVDLDEAVEEFFKTDKKVLLLLGDSGSGKSTYCRFLEFKLWSEWKEGNQIPLFISLPQVKDHLDSIIEFHLQSIGFTVEDIRNLCKENRFLFIFDGYDEINQYTNLYARSNLGQFQAKVIISCRTQYLHMLIESVEATFAPVTRDVLNPSQLVKLYIALFDAAQINDYLRKYAAPMTLWSYEEYKRQIEKIPYLNTLIETPFILRMLVSILPEYVDKHAGASEAIKLTLWDIFEAFINQWFTREKLRLEKQGFLDGKRIDIRKAFLKYSESLATTMFNTGVAEIKYEPGGPWEAFFNPESNDLALHRAGCPLKQVGESTFAFIHKSVQEYFASCGIFAKDDFPYYFKAKLLINDINIIKLLVDKVKESPAFKERLFTVVFSSRTDPTQQIAAANSLTILNAARVSFSGMDLSGIKAPASCLYGGIFHNTNLEEADLEGANLENAILLQANLTRANLSKIYIGDYYILGKHEDQNIKLQYSSDGKRIISIGRQTLKVWDAESGNLIGEISIDSRPFAISSDLKLLCIMSYKALLLWDLEIGQQIRTRTHDGDIFDACEFTLDGKRVVFRSKDFLSIWDIDTGEVLGKPIPHRGPITLSPDGRWLFSSSKHSCGISDTKTGQLIGKCRNREEYNSYQFFDGIELITQSLSEVKVWNIQTGEVMRTLFHLNENESRIEQCIYSSDEKRLIIMCSQKRGSATYPPYILKILDVETQLLLIEHSMGTHSNPPRFSLSPNRKYVMTSHGIFNIETGVLILHVAGHLIWSSDETHLLVLDKTLYIFDVKSGTTVRKLVGGASEFSYAEYSPDQQHILTNSINGTIRIWDQKTGILIGEHNGQPKKVFYSPNGQQLVCYDDCYNSTATSTITIHEAKLRKTEILVPFMGHTSNICGMCYSPDRSHLISVSTHPTSLRIWDGQNGQLIGESSHEELAVGDSLDNRRGIYYSPDGKRIISIGSHRIVILDAKTGKLIGTPLFNGREFNPAYVEQVEFSPDGKLFIATFTGEKTWHIYNTETGEKIGRPIQHMRYLSGSYAERELPSLKKWWAPDGKKLISRPNDTSLQIWNAETGQLIGETIEHCNSELICWLATEKKLIIQLEDHSLQIWNVEIGIPVGEPLKGHTKNVHKICLSPDEKHFVSISFREEVMRVWNIETGKPIGEPIEGRDFAFSPDGKQLVSAGRTIQIWDIETGAPLGKPCDSHGYLRSVQYSPDGKCVVFLCEDSISEWKTRKVLRVLDVTTQEFVSETTDIYEVTNLQFSPDGKQFVFLSHRGGLEAKTKMIQILEIETGQLKSIDISSITRGNMYYSNELRFSLDGQQLIYSTLRPGAQFRFESMWDRTTGQPSGVPTEENQQLIWGIQYSLDGIRAISYKNHAVIFWKKNLKGQWVIDNYGREGPLPFIAEGAQIKGAILDKSTRASILSKGAIE